MKKWEYKVIKVEKRGDVNAFGDFDKDTICFIFKDIGKDFTYDAGTSSFVILNQLGAEGWELVDSTEFTVEGSTSEVNYNFKREIE